MCHCSCHLLGTWPRFKPCLGRDELCWWHRKERAAAGGLLLAGGGKGHEQNRLGVMEGN